MSLEELTRKMSKYYEKHDLDIEYKPNQVKSPTFKQSSFPALPELKVTVPALPNKSGQSNNTPSVKVPGGSLPKVSPTFNQPNPIPQNPYAKKVSPLLYNPAALQKAQAIAQQAQGKTAQQLRQQNLQNINPFNRPAKVDGVGGANAMAGLGQFNKSLAQTADFILPDVVTPKFLQNTIDYYKNTGDKLAQNAANVNEEKGVPQWAGQVVQGTVAAVPNAILALMSGGTSLGAQTIGQTSTGLVGSVGSALKELAKNPMFYSSLIQTAGPEYEQAKANGATELEATLTAIIGSIVNSGIEIGGGIEAVAKNPISLKNWVKGMLDEGKEEVLQGIISQATAKATYDKDKAWVSTTDENAVINPGRMAQEFAGGAVVGGVLGGGQMLAGKALGMPAEQDSYLPPRGENATAAELAGRLDINDPQPGKLPTVTRREQRALDALSAKTGVNIQIDDDIKGSNGYFDRNTNTLHISRNSNNAVYQVAAHEITHSFESNPEEWNQIYEIANANLSAEARANLEDLLKATGYTDAQMQSEVVSHYVQQCVTDIKSFEQLVGVNRTLAQRIVDAFESFVRKLTGQQNIGSWQETAQLREFIGDITPEQAQQTLAQMKKALASGGQTTGEGTQHSKRLLTDGSSVVVIPTNIFEGKTGKKHEIVADYIADHIGEVYTIIESGQKVYIGEDLPGEYTHSKATQTLLSKRNKSQLNAKNQASQEFGELIEIATNRRWEEAKDKVKHAKDAKYGFYKYDTKFAIPANNAKGYEVYNATLLIRNDADGKKYLYDILGIKENSTANLTSTFNKVSQWGAQNAQAVTVSNTNNTQNSNSVNNQNSLKLTPEAIKQNANTAEQYFGTTISPKTAGYLTVNGRMLDFSGRKFGAPGYSRTMDHREITNAFGDDYGGDGYSDGMIQFMAEGNIRLAPESGGIDLCVKPNELQEIQLQRYIRTFGGEVIVDFSRENGDIDGSVEYPARTPASLILQEIRDYFDKGKMPENFDYSRKLNFEGGRKLVEQRTGMGLPYNPNAPKPLPKNPAQGKFGGNTVGAAQPNPGSYANLQTEYGVVDPGENPARMIDMPKKDANGQVNSLFARTVAESEHMPDEMVEEWENAVARGDFSHSVATDKAAISSAERKLSQGWDKAMGSWQ